MRHTQKPNPAIYWHNFVEHAPWKDYKVAATDLKEIYQANIKESTLQSRYNFSEK